MVIGSVYEWAKREPDKTALVWNGKAVSYGRFARGIEVVRRFVREHDLPIGSTAIVAHQVAAGLLDRGHGRARTRSRHGHRDVD